MLSKQRREDKCLQIFDGNLKEGYLLEDLCVYEN
jgi:hypothetical protein